MKAAIFHKFSPRRVDVQVSLLTASVVVLSSLCVYWFGYTITYNDMLYSLRERVESIYTFIDEKIAPESFTDINSEQDMLHPVYLEMKQVFKDVKHATGVQYLYTAKRAEDGTLVYVIDGLEHTASDFRFPGDPIESEIVPALELALAGEQVLPDDIKHTTWGDIFITYLPIHGAQGTVVGAVGIEFPAEHQYKTYQLLRRFIPILILLSCLIAGLLALVLFRRISNPHFQDLANTDSLTGLKNRNAYELDTRNLMARGLSSGYGLMICDLNGLKKTNDTLGHEVGDLYIKVMAQALRAAAGSDSMVVYRMGGDEFAVLVKAAKGAELIAFSEQLAQAFELYRRELPPHASYSIGWAICTGDFEQVYQAADAEMYLRKKDYYAQHMQ